MHRAGHWLGMDVHDAGLYQVKGASQKLVPGMVLTVEPGTYIRPADNVPDEFWDIGVRIEDDVLVTATGIENLTLGAPKIRGRGRGGLPPVSASMPRGIRRRPASTAARRVARCCMTSPSSAPARSARRWRSRSPPATST